MSGPWPSTSRSAAICAAARQNRETYAWSWRRRATRQNYSACIPRRRSAYRWRGRSAPNSSAMTHLKSSGSPTSPPPALQALLLERTLATLERRRPLTWVIERLTPHARQREFIESPAKRKIIRRSEEHTSELQSQSNLVCRLLLEKKTL